jgi:hypothetical protein
MRIYMCTYAITFIFKIRMYAYVCIHIQEYSYMCIYIFYICIYVYMYRKSSGLRVSRRSSRIVPIREESSGTQEDIANSGIYIFEYFDLLILTFKYVYVCVNTCRDVSI